MGRYSVDETARLYRGRYATRPMSDAKRLVVPIVGKVSPGERAELLHQRPVTVWLTGLSASGKSTLATELERRLVDAGRPCYLLDGDNIRTGISRDLGFGPEDRHENIRRIAEVARLMNEAGLVAITAFISPYRADRAMARSVVGTERFIEVHVAAPLEVCEKRDPKGFYAKARRGAAKSRTLPVCRRRTRRPSHRSS